jgi:hypothetical protein
MRFSIFPRTSFSPGTLEVGDLADVAAALAPRSPRFAGLVDSLDRLVPADALQHKFRAVGEGHQEKPPTALEAGPEPPRMGETARSSRSGSEEGHAGRLK